MPAVEAGLDLDQRVVRRHVARLEAAGWLGRAPWVWGEGSVAWLTGLGVESVGTRWLAAGQGAAVADHDRSRRPRRMVGGTSGETRPRVEIGPRARARAATGGR